MDHKTNQEHLSEQKKLTERLSEAARVYYMENQEIMPNIEYDRLCDRLAVLEAETGTVLAGSPTLQVGYTVSSELAREAHPWPLLSLDKTKSVEALADWLGARKGLLSWKLDGLTVVLTYRKGRLEKAVTRGDGAIGEVITPNAKTFENIPLRIPFQGELLLRGEAVIRYSDFDRINAEIEDAEARYKNPRNLSSGSVRQLNSEITAKRHVRYYAFGLVSAEGEKFANSRENQMKFLESIGFQTVGYQVVTGSEIEKTVQWFAREAGDSDLPSDGLVLTYDDIAYGQSLGQTAKFPRDAIAFKWEDEQKETRLTGVEWSASRTGLINPIALFEPVEIDGTTVSRASLHNISIAEDLRLGIGDQVTVYKANMIIPQIADNLTRTGGLPIPEKCPVCDSLTEIRDSGGVRSLYCTNERCLARQIKSFTHFVSKSALNIDGLSESTLEKFIAKGFVHEFADLFRLAEHRDEIVKMEGLGQRSFENLMAATESARNTTRVRLLYSLGIPTIGLANAKVVCKFFGYDWSRIQNATAEDLVQIDGVGEVMAENFVAWFADETNGKKLARLLSEITFAEEKAPDAGGSLRGMTFVITGTLKTWENRDALKAVIEGRGGKVTGAVSEKTTYLINNDVHSPSSKNKKAKALGVRIISEEDFRAMTDGD